jgi:hypothetical protein
MAAHDSPTPRELVDLLEGRWWTGEGAAARALALAQEEWDNGLADRAPTPEDAEICRQAMLAAARCGKFDEVRIWRVRALSRFISVRWRHGAGSRADDRHVPCARCRQ